MNFQDQEIRALENASLHGDKARQVQNGADWKWLQEYIYGAIFDEATLTIENARTEEDRVKAQQMFLACKKPRKLLESLISQGDAALASLKELSGQNPTLENQEEQNA